MTRTSPQLVRIDPSKYRKLEVVSSRDLADFLQELTIQGHMGESDLSFGSVVVRNARGSDMAAGLRWLRTHAEASGNDLGSETFSFDSAFHTDSKLLGSVTMHITRNGTCEYVQLVGAEELHEDSTAQDLVDVTQHHRITTGYCTEPRQVIVDTLSKGDLLIFDHSQPHAFWKTSEDRLAVPYYIN